MVETFILQRTKSAPPAKNSTHTYTYIKSALAGQQHSEDCHGHAHIHHPKAMQLSRNRIHLSQGDLHNSIVLTNGSNSSGSSSNMSPTHHKETCTKNVLSDDTHIFSAPSSESISPISSFDDSAMNSSIASSNSLPIVSDRLHASMGSMGLPTAYPAHRKSTSLTSMTLEEELEDFEIFETEVRTSPLTRTNPLNPSCSRPLVENPLKLSRTGSNQSTGSGSTAATSDSSQPSVVRGGRHRRQRTEISSLEGFVPMKKAVRHRRGNNQAMGPKDFHDQVLTSLFEDLSVDEFRY